MIFSKWKSFFRSIETDDADRQVSATRYVRLRRNLIILMILVSTIPLTLMAVVNFLQYRRALSSEIDRPMRAFTNKSRHSLELFLAERLSVVDFIASAYSYGELADEKKLRRIFRVVKQEFKGFVDLGLIDSNGLQNSYVGPYQLEGKKYKQQEWFHKVQIRGSYVSDVFMGHRGFPHIVLAVQRMTDEGDWWIVRATIDTAIFEELIGAMGLDSESDAFIVNGKGILQTQSRFYGQVLDKCSMCMFPPAFEAAVIERVDARGREIVLAHSNFVNSDFVLVLVKPRAEVLRAWYTLKSELFYLFLGSIVVIVLIVIRLSGTVVQRIRRSDERGQLAFREMEHTHKLSSIGRLAAGVAHEINNPMAIIDQKTGLLRDLVESRDEVPQKERILSLTDSVLQAVDRCRTITHRLLGFARRMEVENEALDLNQLVKEVLGFLEKEAMFRSIDIQLSLAGDLPRISSDRGQLQQVFLNILTNAFAAVEDGGRIEIVTREKDRESVTVTIQDNGSGMSEETLRRIFEPFFTTKTDYGTGLGLSITYGIIKKLGGDIDVESKLGRGTTFTVSLPRKSAEIE